jgi:hypothetical protein
LKPGEVEVGEADEVQGVDLMEEEEVVHFLDL